MYTSFFGLAEKPFAITPDPRYLFLSERHAEALAHLLYGIDDAGGFVQLTGEVGTGKTTMVRSLLVQIPAHADVALILNPRLTPEEFLLAICDELHLAFQTPRVHGSVKALVDHLNAMLLDAHARGRRVVVIVDEAQQLSADVLEQVRLLTNLETARTKLLQIILVGQPELRELLARNDLRQLAQRITGRYHLDPLARHESAAYVRHRLRVAGATSELFTDAALAELHRLAHGVPRLINVIADRALLGAYTREQRRVTPALVRLAASEVHGRSFQPPWQRWAVGGAGALVALLLAVTLWQLNVARSGADRTPESVPAVARPAGAAGGAAGGTASAAGVAGAIAGNSAAGDATPPVLAGRPATPSLADFMATHAAATGTDDAFKGLFALWQLQFTPGGARPCDQAAAQGLACLAQKGAFAQLRTLNRPAILSLVDAAGAEHQLVLSALDGDAARLHAGNATLDASLIELQRYWYGDFLVLWKPPLPHALLLRPGAHGAGVRWLRDGLRTVRGERPAAGPDAYDAELEQRVADFQRAHRLAVDGIAGEQTQALLDALLGSPGTPTLRVAGG